MIAKFVQKYLDVKYREVDKFVNKPIDTQTEVFNYLIRNGKNTLIGTQFDFASIKTKMTLGAKFQFSNTNNYAHICKK